MPVLQARQSSPRTMPVLWLWSICSFTFLLQIAQRPLWLSTSFFNSLNKIPWCFARAFRANSGSAFRRAYRRAFIASLFRWYDCRASSFPLSLFCSYQLRFFACLRSLFFWCQVRLLAASLFGCGRGDSPSALRSAYHALCLARTSVRCSARNLFCHAFLYLRRCFSVSRVSIKAY